MRKVLNITLYILVVFAFQEIAFRVCFPLPEVLNFNRSNYIPKLDGVESIAPMRYEKKTFQSYPDTLANFVHKLNGYGFRDAEWKVEKAPNKKRIMFIGDSFTEGAMVGQDETITHAFKSVAGDNYEVMNLGIIGAGLPEYTPLIADAVKLFKPDYLFLVLFSNDISNRRVEIPKLTEMEYSKSYVPRLFVLLKMLMMDEPLPYRWKSATSFMPAVPSPLNPWTTQGDEFVNHVDKQFADAMKAGNYNTFRINYAAAQERYLKEPVDLAPYIKWVKEYIANFGTKLLVCYIPGRQQVSNYYYQYELPTCRQLCPDTMDLTTAEYQIHHQYLGGVCKYLDLPYVNLTPVIAAEEAQDNHLYWNYDDHMRAKGYKLVGETIYRQWERD